MTRSIRGCLLALLLSTFSVGLMAQDRVSTQPRGDVGWMPSTVTELIASVDTVILGRVRLAGKPERAVNARGTEFVARVAQIDTIEVIKGPANKAGGGIAVRQVGGTIDVDGRELSTRYVEDLLRPGDVVLLFLQRVGDVYVIANGPAGLVKRDKNGHADVPSQLRHVKGIPQDPAVPIETLVKIIRDHGAKR
jgi:hypothetical protein